MTVSGEVGIVARFERGVPMPAWSSRGSIGLVATLLVAASPGGAEVTLSARGACARLAADGAHLLVEGRHATLAATSLGRGDSSVALAPGALGHAGDTARADRGHGVVEWWRALDAGLEHGLVIDERPEGSGPLSIALSIRGDLHARSGDGDSLTLVDARGETVARYGGLEVVDAAGARVPASMHDTATGLGFVIDDATAQYPIVVDPLLVAEEATLAPAGSATADEAGWSVVLSSDGARAFVGVANDQTGGRRTGSVRVYLRTGTNWAEEAILAEPAAPVAEGLAYGRALAVTADGSLAIAGARFATVGTTLTAGVARVFRRSGTTWVAEQALAAAVPTTNGLCGLGVALSADGTRALVGCPGDDPLGAIDAGSAAVYVRSGTTWTFETTLAPTGLAAGDGFGYAAALSADGSVAMVGAPLDDTAGGANAGTVRVFRRTGTSWVEEATLAAAGGAANDDFGVSLALSNDGSRAVVGAELDDVGASVDAGSARVFLRTGTTWAEEALLSLTGSAGNSVGRGVALDADGARAVVGAPNRGGGAVAVFTRSGTTWTLEPLLPATGVAAGDIFGSAVGVSADGTRAIAGAPYDATAVGTRAGSARVFTLAATTGSGCFDAAECQSGFCVDSVCCTSACAGGASDCQACSSALTGVANGTCAPLSATGAPTVTCRPAAGPCDAPEVCVAGSAACPTDARAAATTVCRAATSVCDAAEACDGTAVTCPADAAAAAGTVCRPAAGACDAEEVCVGSTCPVDVVRAMGVVCRSTLGSCDPEELCDGASPSCPADVRASAGTVCASSVAGPCDLADLCDGTAPDCPPRYQPAGHECAPAGSGACDAPDVCTGTSADCMPTFAVGVECRPASGSCDVAESCTGAGSDCPPDVLLAAGVSCRASTASCDPAETCDGLTSQCPVDGTMCADTGIAPVDAGTDASRPLDAAARPDASTEVPAPAGGCACRTSGRPPLGPSGFVALGLAIIALERHHRRRG